MNKFANKKIFIAPKTPMSIALKSKLEKYNIDFLDFIDKNKNECKKINEAIELDYDYIFIFSPNHAQAIYKEYLEYIPKEKIYVFSIQNGKYRYTNNIDIEKNDNDFSMLEIKRDNYLFISKDFITANNKFLYLYCIRNNIPTLMLTDNKEQYEELKQHNLPVKLLKLDSNEEISKAKYIIFDQGNFTYLPKLHKSQKIIQLWHGVGLKKMSKNINLEYDYFVSTSTWTNETNFKNIFLSKEFLNSGYPRNDVFFYDEDELDLLFCDKEIYDLLRNKDNKKVYFYMPTHRENGFKLAFDLELLDKELKKIDSIFILKLHPFILSLYKDEIDKNKYENIYFHNAYGDIYPLLKYSDGLITDYSSIAYDYLMLDKPIYFYVYDLDDYTKNMELLFDFDEYTPGIKVKTQNELLSSLIKQDTYKTKREKIAKVFFDEIDGNSSKRLINILRENDAN